MADAMETTSGTESSLSTWAGPYVTDMLGKAEAFSNLPFQQYTGQLTAGTSPLQTQAFQGIGALTVPSDLTQAGQTLGQLSTADIPPYQTGTFTNQYQAPTAYQAGTFSDQFQAPTTTPVTQFTNQYQAPAAYQASTFTPDQYSTSAIQPYMNPYLEAVLAPQQREAIRQADIARNQMQSRMAQAGSYGGSRQAIMESEAQRNLQTLLGDITGKGYASAFDTAQQQFGNEQARRLQAAQFGEGSRQFGAQQAAQAAQLQAQYGLNAQQAQEAARQFASGQAMTAAELQARYGLSAQQAAEASRQFGAQQAAQAAQLGAQYGTEAQRMAEQSRQYGAGLGLQNLQAQIQAAQAQAGAGAQQAQYGLANVAQQLAAGQQQRAIEQEGLTAAYNQFLREEQYPQQRLEFQRQMLAGLPLAAASFYQPAPSAFQSAAGGAATTLELLKLLGQIK